MGAGEQITSGCYEIGCVSGRRGISPGSGACFAHHIAPSTSSGQPVGLSESNP